METTLNLIRSAGPCREGWGKLLRYLGKTSADDEPLPILTILDSNGLDDALWCLRAVAGHDAEKRLFAVWCAKQVKNLMTDARSHAAIDVAERFAKGTANGAELQAAGEAAGAAARAAAGAAARAAAGEAAGEAAWAAAWEAARAAAGEAARAAAGAAARAAAGEAAGEAAWAAAGAAARAAQGVELRRICSA